MALQLACYEHDYKWPDFLPSGVMWYDGHKITIDEFNEWSRKFK